MKGRYWLLTVGLVLAAGLGLTRQWAIDQAQAIQAQTMAPSAPKTPPTPPPDLSGLRQRGNLALDILAQTAIVPGWSADQTLAARTRSNLIGLERDYQASERFQSANRKAMDAAQLVQNPPHPVDTWLKAQQLWQGAIDDLTAVPPEAAVGALAAAKVPLYRQNLGAIGRQLANAQEAVNLNNQAVTALEQKQFQKAIGLFSAALDRSPKLAESYLGRGLAFAGLASHQTAILDYNRAVAITGNFVDAYYERGQSHEALGQDSAALNDYDLTIRFKENEARAYLSRGAVRFRLGDAPGSYQDFQKAAKFYEAEKNAAGQEVAMGMVSKVAALVPGVAQSPEPTPTSSLAASPVQDQPVPTPTNDHDDYNHYHRSRRALEYVPPPSSRSFSGKRRGRR